MTPDQYADRIMKSAADMALYFAGMPDDRVHATMAQVQTNIERGLADEVGAELAATGAGRARVRI